MIIDDYDYDDEEWRIARVLNARRAGDEHRALTLHHGEVRETHYACLDCQTAYFDSSSSVEDSPVKISAGPPVDERLLTRLIELGVRYAEDLDSFRRFLEKVALEHNLPYSIPDLKSLRDEIQKGGTDPPDSS